MQQLPLHFLVATCNSELRTEVDPQLLTNVWIGWLRKELRVELNFSLAEQATIEFVSKDAEEPCLPFIEALISAAEEKFQISSPSPEVVQ